MMGRPDFCLHWIRGWSVGGLVGRFGGTSRGVESSGV